LVAFESVFTLPSFALFCQLVSAWVLCPGRHTVTRMLGMLDSRRRRPHDAYHRFLRAGAWSLGELWRLLAGKLVASLVPQGSLLLDLDDTLFHKAGRKIEGAGVFRDAVRSTRASVVYALGLNLMVLTLRVRPPWGGEPLGLPVNLRLYRKGGPSHLDLGEEMIRQLAGWFPDRKLSLCCDGAFASLAGRSLPRTHVTSRMRRDAALFELPPPRKPRRRGRPRKRGRRLRTPEGMARHSQGWTRKTVDFRGRLEKRILLVRPVLWYSVRPDRQVLLVIVRDPTGKQHDDFFFTTDLDDTPEDVASRYAGRWSIEDTFRNVKQFLGGEDPQTWKHQGPERAAALSLWVYSAVWHWYLTTQGTRVSWPSLPWYQSKKTPSFPDALASLRRILWGTIISTSAPRSVMPKTVAVLIEALARAA
jgi:hypothetical protein